ncbi:MAG TPA: phosphoribosylformylglycinamidine synthase subunit PurL [Elusimicrobia bacterium]|nr:phosphoribosylformylglycinamidine synthase subunit PurL [Elusimicrobiota bacterium]
MSRPLPATDAAAWPQWACAPVKALQDLSARHGWSLSADELKAVQAHFAALKREPTRAEVEMLAQSWSEHCRHKTFRSPIRLKDGRSTRLIKSLLEDTLMAATRKLAKPWCLSVFKDNAGVVEFDKRWALAYKVETHNHPCAIEPYGGAETGVGGVIRDVLGVGLGAKPVLNTDVFCFCPPDYAGELPEGVLHPRRTLTCVVAGVRDYGNRMGIPTAAGAVYFDEGYRFNPLVFVGTVGLMPHGAVHTSIQPGDAVVAIGGRTGRDGLHGATFSSTGLDKGVDSTAVQIGHAICEKRVLDALLRARSAKLYRALTDCGAGGFSSAVGEMAARVQGKGGARVDLAKALLKVSDLEPWEVWLSEAQERMVLAVPPKNLKALQELMAAESVEACVLGEFTSTGRIEVLHGEQRIVDLDLDFVHDGLPLREQAALWEAPKTEPPAPLRLDGERCAQILRWAVSHLNVCSREWIIRQYDHEVQGGTVVKPLQGIQHDGPGDACVIWPIAVTEDPSDYRGFAVAHGINPALGKDPYAMALACVDEALANLVCVGADVSKAALLDNFCWGSPKDPRQLGALVRAAEGCRDAALGFETPFISGKDSLHNEFIDAKGRAVPIPGTLLISAIAPVPDIRRALTMDMKGPRNALYIVGRTAGALGGSLLAQHLELHAAPCPEVDVRAARDAYRKISLAAQKGLLLSAHDLSEGGLAAAASEMGFSGDTGVEIDLDKLPRAKDAAGEAALLFSETPSRILLEVSPECEKEFLKALRGTLCARIGTTLANPVLRILGLDGRIHFEEGLRDLKALWQKTLPEKLLVGLNARNGGKR